jgi:DNA-binding winged helix-turn-helix (wHTH) protein
MEPFIKIDPSMTGLPRPPDFAFAEYRLDVGARRLRRGAVALHVSPKAFDLLALLLQHRDRVLSKQELHDALWPGIFVTEANLQSLVAELRRALDDSAQSPRFLRTVHRVGYAFCGTASESDVAPALTASCWLVWRAQELPLRDGENLIGRDEGVQVRIDAPSVSRRHARITVTSQAVTVEDLGSKNGTLVNDGPLDGPKALADLDALTIGSVQLTVRIMHGGETTQTVER